jgi:hypothetical protein
MDMIEEQDHPMDHRLGEEGMNMMGSNMVEVDDMNTVEVHFLPMNHWSKVEGMNMVEKHFHPMNHRPEVESMDTMDTGMEEDKTTELEVVGREPEGMVLVRLWTGEASSNSSGVGGVCEIRVFKRSTHVCNSGL